MRHPLPPLAATLALLLATPALAATPAKPAIGSFGVDTSGLSKTVRPGDDFYRYVNESWLKLAQIPAGMAGIDPFVEAELVAEARAAAIIDKARAANGAPGTPAQMIADLHAAHADMARRNALGLTPIAGQLAALQKLDSHDALARAMAPGWRNGLFISAVGPDADDPARQIATLGAAGTTLPSRDYYLNDGEPYAGYRKALRAYMADSFRRAGFADADARADRTFALELALAKLQWSPQQMRDVVRMNHVMSPAELKAYAPGFPWDAWLDASGYAGQTRLKVVADTSARDTAALFAATPVADVQSLLLFHTLDFWAPYLSEPWVQAHFDFHNGVLQGVSARRTPDKETVAFVNGALGEEIGRIYVDNYFSAGDRAEVAEMVDYLLATYRARIQTLPWMDAPTRAAALTKLDKISRYIGYPDRWHDRSAARIKPDDLVGSMAALIAWQQQDDLAKLAEGTRLWEFAYPPQEINAGYSPSRNSITFPAGILQPPFFDPNADVAVNFGSIAAVIGHEIGHAFDDQGSRADGDGRLRNWWTPQSRAEFEKRTAGLVAQYDQYEPLPGTRINGRQNLGENIGDLGGLSVAHAAYRKYVADKQGGRDTVLDGYSGDQRFFLAWAQVWREHIAEAEQRRRLLSDPHSPGEYRTNGVVRNVDAWYDAFNVKPGDKLYLPPASRVKIW